MVWVGIKTMAIEQLVDKASEGDRKAIVRLEKIVEEGYWFRIDGLPIQKWLKKIKIHFHLLNSTKGGDVKLRVGRKLNGNISELGQGFPGEDQSASCTKGKKRAR